MSQRRNGLFNGFWTDLEGNRIRRIYRDEYAELYRLHRLCAETERANAKGFTRWVALEDGYALIRFPAAPAFYERHAA